MDAPENSLKTPRSGAPRNDLAGLLGPGVVTVDPRGDVRFADTRALELLGCADGFELERLWERLKGRLEGAGLSWNGAGGQDQRAVLDLAVETVAEEGAAAGERRLLFDLRREPESGGVLLVHSLETLTGLESDLRLTSQMRSVSQISPAVAHDLRAPINAMVFNIEIAPDGY
jgi:signal transduction histidine kinase